MLHTLFTEFDKLTDKHGVYKIETIGESHDAGRTQLTIDEHRLLLQKPPLVNFHQLLGPCV